MSEERLKSFLEELRGKPVSVVLFGSRARGNHTPASDYDLLLIKGSAELQVSPALLEPTLYCTAHEVRADELGDRIYYDSLTLAAVLEGRLLMDNLGIAKHLTELRERALREGAEIGPKAIRFPRRGEAVSH